MPIIHAFSCAKADGADTSIVRPGDWNSAHSIGTGVFANSQGVTFGVAAGSQVTASVNAPAGYLMQFPIELPPVLGGFTHNSATTAAGSTTASFLVWPLIIPAAMQVSDVKFMMSSTLAATQSTASHSFGASLGIYTLNGTNLSLVTSWLNGMQMSWHGASSFSWLMWTSNSTSGSTALSSSATAGAGSVFDLKMVPFKADTASYLLSGGQYWFAFGISSLTAGANNVTAPLIFGASQASSTACDIGLNTASSTANWPFNGYFSTNMSAVGMPGAIATAAITTATNAAGNLNRQPHIVFRGTN